MDRNPAPGNGYQDLAVWRKSMDLVESAYELAGQLPSDEKYGLASQMRRSAISVPANIAEGQGRRYRREFVRMLYIARGSLMELETQLLLAGRLHRVSRSHLERVLESSGEVGKMLNGLIRSIEDKIGESRVSEPCSLEPYGPAFAEC